MVHDVFFDTDRCGAADRSAKKLKFYTPSPALEALFESFRVKNDTVGATVLLEPAVGQTRGMSLWKLGVRITKDRKVTVLFHIVDWIEESHTFVKQCIKSDFMEHVCHDLKELLYLNDWDKIQRKLLVGVLENTQNIIRFISHSILAADGDMNDIKSVVVMCNDDIIEDSEDKKRLIKDLLFPCKL